MSAHEQVEIAVSVEGPRQPRPRSRGPRRRTMSGPARDRDSGDSHPCPDRHVRPGRRVGRGSRPRRAPAMLRLMAGCGPRTATGSRAPRTGLIGGPSGRGARPAPRVGVAAYRRLTYGVAGAPSHRPSGRPQATQPGGVGAVTRTGAPSPHRAHPHGQRRRGRSLVRGDRSLRRERCRQGGPIFPVEPPTPWIGSGGRVLARAPS